MIRRSISDQDERRVGGRGTENGNAGLDDVLMTHELARRPSRVPDYEAESRGLRRLADVLATDPRSLLHALAETTMELCRADSAGVSILHTDEGTAGGMFRWPAVVGMFAAYAGDGMPRDASPCGVVLDRDEVLLFRHPERFFPYPEVVDPPMVDVLLAPFHVDGQAVGTVWAIMHQDQRAFDREDVRLLTNLAQFASAGYQHTCALDAAMEELHERTRREDELRELNETLERRVRRRTRKIRELASKLTMAEQEERRRVSRILHDDLQQLMYGIQLKMHFVRRSVEGDQQPRLVGHVDEALRHLGQAIETTRRLTVDLSPIILDGEGLADMMLWLRTQMRELHSLDVDLRAEHAFYIPDDDMRVLLFQIVRELLFNVVKHAETDRARVVFEENDGCLVIHVIDRGRGFDVGAMEAEQAQLGGFGLFTARERLALFGGRIVIDSTPGEGTRVSVYTTVETASPQKSLATP